MTYKKAVIDDLLWEADLKGEEVGHSEIEVIGIYSSESLNVNVLIDYDTGKVVEIWSNEEEAG